MKRTLLISIHPKWAEKILNGEKTIEVRSWIPKDYAGWVYVYVTKGKDFLNNVIWDIEQPEQWHVLHGIIANNRHNPWNGKVAFRFWYEKVERIYWTNDEISLPRTETNGVIKFAQKTCLLVPELEKYLNGKVGYAWHIDKLEIFDKPKELGEFYKIKYRTEFEERYIPIKQAPQSWQYIYIKEDK